MAYAQILVVADQHCRAEEIQRLLEQHGYAVAAVASSEETALTQTEARRPELVVIDVELPDQLQRKNIGEQIRARFDTPVVYLTPAEEAMPLPQAHRPASFAELVKPFTGRELQMAVETALYKYNLERQLRESEAKFRVINDAAPDAIIMVDHEGQIAFWNKAAERMFGYSSQEVFGKELHAFLAPQRYYEAAKQGLGKYTLTGQGAAMGKTLEMTAVKKDGVEFPIELSLSAIRLKDKWSAIGILRDITDRKQHEKQLRELNQQLHEAMRLKSNFLASMSHELRTPLNAMIGYTSLTLNALKDRLPPEHLQNLTRAEQSARILLQLINDVLDFSKIEAGRLQTFIEEIELRDLLEDLMLTAEGLLSEKPVALQSDFPQDLPVIESDYTRVKQILSNLIDNAIKFTATGAVMLRAIPITPASSPIAGGIREGVRIEVEDTGCGIPAELLESIFDIRQADGSLTKKFKGTGLGLALTKKLSEMLGIKIGVRSEVNKGTMFWLDLPAKFQAAASQTPALLPTLPPEASPTTPETPVLGATATEKTPPAAKISREAEKMNADLKAMVLCFCDQEMCLSLKRHLVGLPLDVQPVTTAAECIAIGNRAPVWAIVLEADENGFKMLTQLKSDPSIQQIPIIMSSPEMAQYGFHVGSLEYLEKPIDNQKLLEALLRITRVPKGDILVVDDDATLRNLYGHVLSQAGYTTYTADNGIAALHTLRDHTSFQAIVLDLMMPDMDGFQVLDQIQRDQNWQRIPVVVVTGKTLSAEEKNMLRNGTQMLLEKDKFPAVELSKKIESIIQTVTLAGTRSILVIDDNEMNLNLMTSVFESAGYTVFKAASAQDGIALAKDVLPNTILMDLAMPGMDGFAATRILKQQPETAAITVIACSAFTAPEYKEKAAQVGCEGYITKPIEPNRLIEQVTRFMLTSKIKQKFAL